MEIKVRGEMHIADIRQALFVQIVQAQEMGLRQAIDQWLDICEKEGRDGRDPVSWANVRDIFLDKFLFTDQLKRLKDASILWNPHVPARQ